MAFYNTEETLFFSGLARSTIGVSALGDQHTLAYANSGAQTIASGAGVLISVIGLAGPFISGTIAPASNSGAVVAIIDGVSGTTPKVTSGGASIFASNTNGILYYFNFGNASGANSTLAPQGPPTVTNLNAVFKSGLIAVLSGGPADSHAVSLIWSKAV